MNREWDLNVMYQGYDDPAYGAEYATLLEKIEAWKQCMARLDTLTPCEALHQALLAQEEAVLPLQKLFLYTSLRQATNTADATTVAWMDKLRHTSATTTELRAAFVNYVGRVEDLEACLQADPFLAEYAHLLRVVQQSARYTLAEPVEAAISLMNLSAGSAWGSLQEYLTSTVQVDYRGEKLNLSAVRNLAYDADPDVRRDAYEAEIASYDRIKDPVAFALNNLKQQVNNLCDLRKAGSALDLTLRESQMQRTTLDAMFAAIDEALPKFHAYLRRKAKLLGYEGGLKWWDLFAPMGQSSRRFTTEEARDYLVSHFQGFAPDLAEMVQTAFDDAWIDFYPHNGKVGGAFCAGAPWLKQSRILTNFDGAFGDVVTLAHELGHAYHGKQVEDHRVLNGDYSMPVAETASTFNETVIMNAAIAESTGEEQLALLESQLQDTTQIICDIYSRYRFESAVFAERKQGFLFPDKLCEMMLQAQKESYGDGLAAETLHPYMWVCKSHYYSESLSFYNFPYAFGGLFATGLYARYLQEGEAFLPKYRALLHETCVRSVEDVAKMADIDLGDVQFWRDSLAVIGEKIDLFLQLTE